MVLAYIFTYCHHNRVNDELEIDMQQEEYLNGLEIDMQQEEYLNGHHRNGIQIYNPTFEIHNIESLEDDEVISQKSLNLEDNFIEYSFIQDNILENKIEYVINGDPSPMKGTLNKRSKDDILLYNQFRYMCDRTTK